MWYRVMPEYERVRDGELIECAPGTPNGLDANCDGLDNDCDGQTDEDFTATVYGHEPVRPANVEMDKSAVCQDLRPQRTTIQAAMVSIATATASTRITPWSVVVGACERQSSCTDGVEAACRQGVAQGVDESCDGVDDDCDGAIDENFIACGPLWAPVPAGLDTCEGRF